MFLHLFGLNQGSISSQWSVVPMFLLFHSQFGAFFLLSVGFVSDPINVFVKNARASKVDWL